MKKISMFIAMVAMAGIASADLVNGDFSATNTLVTASGNFADANSSLGVWEMMFTNNWLISGGKLVRDTSSEPANIKRVAQIFESNLTAGNYNLRMDYDFIGGDLGDVTVTLLYYDGAGANLVYDNRQHGYQSTFRTGVQLGYTVSNLGSTQLATGSYTAADVVSFNVPTDYSGDRLMIIIDTITLASSNTLSFDNISIVAVPEPATVGMIGVGALIAMGIRRFSRRA